MFIYTFHSAVRACYGAFTLGVKGQRKQRGLLLVTP